VKNLYTNLKMLRIETLNSVSIFIISIIIRLFFTNFRLLGTDIVNQGEFVANTVYFMGFPDKRLFMSPGSEFTYPPLAVLIEAIVSTMLNIKPVYCAYYLSILSSSANVLMVYLLAKQLFKRNVAWFATLIAMFAYPDLLLLGWSSFPSIFGIFLVSCLFYCLIMYLKYASYFYLILFSFLLGFLGLSHTYSFLLAIAVLMIVISLCKKRFNIIKALLLACLITLPWYSYRFYIIVPELYTLLFNPVSFQRIFFRAPFNLVTIFGLPFLHFSLVVVFFGGIAFSVKNKCKDVNFKILAIWFFIPFLLGIVGWTNDWVGARILGYRSIYYASTPLCLIVAGGYNEIYQQLHIKVRCPKLLRRPLIMLFTLSILIFTSFTIIANSFVLLKTYDYYAYITNEEIEALNWISNNLNGIVVSDWHFGQWIAGYSLKPTFCAFPANVYFTNPVEIERSHVAETILSKKDNWLETAFENNVSYIAINTRLRYIDAFVRDSPTYDFYDIAKYMNVSDNGLEIIAWNWSAPTENSIVQIEESSIKFGTNFGYSDVYYSFCVIPPYSINAKYVYFNVSSLPPTPSISDVKILIYYNSSYTEFDEIPMSATGINTLVPLRGRPYEIRFTFYSSSVGQSWYLKIHAIKLFSSLENATFSHLILKYESEHIYIFEIRGIKPSLPSINVSVYPLWLYLPIQIPLCLITFKFGRRLIEVKK
jgi:hypothetical protein